MKTGIKISLVVLITVLLTSLFTFLAFTSLFSRIEKDFYNRRIVDNKSQELNLSAGVFDSYIDNISTVFSNYLDSNFIRSVFIVNQSNSEILRREEVTYGLRSEIYGFQFVRIVDQDGRRIHYSSNPSDEKIRNETRVVYNNWDELDNSGLQDNLLMQNESPVRYFFDQDNARIIIALPVYDTYDLFRGTALFYISIRGIQDYFFKNGVTTAFEETQFVQNQGFIINMPDALFESVQDNLPLILDEIKSTTPVLNILAEDDYGNRYYLISQRNDFVMSSVIPQSELEFSFLTKIILISIFFIIAFLIVFLLFNLRQNPEEMIRQRIKKLQYHFLSEYIQNKEKIEWDVWEKDLKSRRKEIASEIKKGLSGKKKYQTDELDRLIEKSWDELLEVILNKKPEKEQGIDFVQLEKVIRRALTSVSIPVTVQGGAISVANPGVYNQGSAPRAQRVPVDVEELDELDDVEELDEVSTSGMKPVEVEDVDDLEDVEDLDDISTAGMKPVEVEEVDDLEDVEDLDDISTAGMKPVEVEEVDDLEEVEDLDDISTAGMKPVEVEEVDDLEEVEDLDDEPTSAMKPVEVEDVDDLEEVEDLYDEPTSAMKPVEVEEVDDLEEVEDLDDEPISAMKPVEVEDVDDLEDFEDQDDVPISGMEPEDVEEVDDFENISDEITPEDRGHSKDRQKDISKKIAVDTDNASITDSAGTLIREDEIIEELDSFEDLDSAEEIDELEEIESIESVDGFSLPVDEYKPEISDDVLLEDENIDDIDLPEGIEIISYQRFVKDIKQEITSLANQLTQKYSEKGSPTKELSMEDLIRTHSESLFDNFNDVILKNIISEPEDKFFHFTELGFNFDLYQKSFKIGMAGAYKALMQITKKFEALCGGLAALEDDNLKILFGVGLDHESSTKLSVDFDWSWIKASARKKDIIRIEDLRSSPFKNRVDDDRKLIKINAVLYLPVAYKEQQHYMYLGFNALEKEIIKVLTKQV